MRQVLSGLETNVSSAEVPTMAKFVMAVRNEAGTPSAVMAKEKEASSGSELVMARFQSWGPGEDGARVTEMSAKE